MPNVFRVQEAQKTGPKHGASHAPVPGPRLILEHTARSVFMIAQ